MIVIIKPHAEMRMLDRGIREAQVYKILENPAEVILVRYGRLAAHGKIRGRELVVIYEKKNGKIEVITVLWVDERRLQRIGFARI
ncbi:MAG TPA: DUF4258 domain-containing protein [Candidatus Bathyarchaeia archaeon]|nr:DUF4258 domain-containing protein [Candidatus Bathyarchaeia archaeon]